MAAENQVVKLHKWYLCKVFPTSYFLKCAAKLELAQLSRRLGRGWEPPEELLRAKLLTNFSRRTVVHGHINIIPSKIWV